MASSEIFEMAPFVEKASRIELIVRFVYGLAIGIIYGLWSIIIEIVQFLQFFHILILGRRAAGLYRYTRQYLTAYTYVSAYLMFLTDQRPELTPDLIAFFRSARGYSPTVPATPVSDTTGTLHCVNCGAVLPPNAKFCGACGAKQA